MKKPAVAGRGRGKGELPAAKAVELAGLVKYAKGSIVSKTIKKSEVGTVTLFAFDAGESLSEHSAPYDAFVQVLDGTADLTIGGKPVCASAGEIVLMPANVPHALRAAERFKMMLVMIRG